MPSKICVCGKEFFKLVNRSERSWNETAKYCSKVCHNQSKLGHIPWNKGTKGLMVAWNKGKACPQTTGDKNGMWKGGIDSKTLRKMVLARDVYTCQKCGFHDLAIMEVDHIKPKAFFSDVATSLDNLQTLCPNCHARKSLKEKRFKVLIN